MSIKQDFIHLKDNFYAYKKMISSDGIEKYERVQLAHNLYRFRIMCIVLFIMSVVSFIFHMKQNDTTAIDRQTIATIFVVLSIVFFILFSKLKTLKLPNSVLWFFCYAFIVLICSVQFLAIINVTLSQQPSFPFILLISLLVIVPDFKAKATTIIIFAVYAGVILVQLLYMPITVAAINKIYNVTLFTIICIITNFFISVKNMQVYFNEIQLKEMNEHLTLTSTIDELTNLPNRRSFNYFYQNIWKHCQRLKLTICIFMIDIDYFKNYNDTFGHMEGDKALQKVGGALQSYLKRDTDFVARYGGEEFICIVPYLEENEAEAFAKSIVTKVENLEIKAPHGANQFLTVSIGAAIAIPEDGFARETLMQIADQALYEAKDGGRNQLVFYGIEQTKSKT